MSNNVVNVAEAAPRGNGVKLILFVGVVIAAFALTYNLASARSATAPASGAAAVASDPFGQTAEGGGGGCCGGGPAVEGSTVVEGAVQRIAVDTSAGSFNPNVIKAKAGIPIAIDFSQAPGGCLSGVYFPDFGINEDLTGGGKTIDLSALDPGEYTFYCQMQMVSATIVVE